MKLILPSGHNVFFDKKDLPIVCQYKWHIHKNGDNLYAIAETGSRRLGTRKVFSMHRLIMGSPVGRLVDHKNENGLDNRRGNLRLSDKSTNGMNRGAQSNNKSGYKGVCWSIQKNKWIATINIMGKQKYLGRYDCPKKAHQAYKKAADEVHGEFAKY